jgi:hypothetical protein
MGLEKARPGEPWQQQVRSRIEHLGKKYEKAEAITDKWNCLRQIYKEALPLIQEAESGRRGRWIIPARRSDDGWKGRLRRASDARPPGILIRQHFVRPV